MKKLITGGTGLIGSAFKDGVKVGSNDYNLIDKNNLVGNRIRFHY